ncbi:hypothetical protein [Paenisporosarcina sp. TG-14]|uniref:hypothetical protein n=1 Tax=Paenisporosarcina sp. TG-14 TaxID=1231057 RepID=UPI000313EF39|nr:hypothetical protein [Paenisporosarcina sp. TG-14]
MNKTRLKVWSWIALMVGAVIGIGIVYSIEGMPVLPVAIGYIAYGIFLGIYLYFMGRTKMPDSDERTSHNTRNFFAYGSTMLLFFIGFIIFVFYMFGYESIEVGMLAIFFSIAFAVLTLGSFIARKL